MRLRKEMSKYYYTVNALRIPPDIDEEELEHDIDRYLSTADMLIHQLNVNFRNCNSGLLHRNMLFTLKLLKNIHAEQLETAGNLLLKALKNDQTEICQKALPIFTTNLYFLSNELQKAKADHGVYSSMGEIPKRF